MTVPTGKEMAEGISSVLSKLMDKNIAQHDTNRAVAQVRAQLFRNKNARKWAFSIGRGDPVRFEEAYDRDGRPVVPIILAERIEVDEDATPFPFVSWNITLEILDKETDAPVARWHFDLANQDQPGPKLHLQYGGHFHDAREFDAKLSEPRWNSPPMDLVLLAETVAANFHHERWMEMREDPNWCANVHQSQMLCFTPFMKRLAHASGVSSTTALNQMWNDNWS